MQSFQCVTWDAEIADAVSVVPSERDTAEDASVPINGEVVFFFQSVDEVVGVGDGAVFYSEVVNNEAETDGF